MYVRRLLSASLGALVCLLGCSRPQAVVEPADGFSINGQRITKKDMDDYLERQYGAAYKATMAQRALLDQEARKQNAMPDAAEVDAEFRLKKELDWQFASRIAANPSAADEAREEIRIQLEQQRLLAKNVAVTAEEVQQEYAEHAALYDVPRKAHARVAALLDETHAEEIRQLMAQNDPAIAPQAIVQKFPREVVFLGDGDIFTFVQAFGTSMNSAIFNMKPQAVQIMEAGDIAQQGAKKLVVKLLDIVPGKKADLNDPKTLFRIKVTVALRRTSANELIGSLWDKAKFESKDPTEKVQIERLLLPDRFHAETKAKVQ